MSAPTIQPTIATPLVHASQCRVKSPTARPRAAPPIKPQPVKAETLSGLFFFDSDEEFMSAECATSKEVDAMG